MADIFGRRALQFGGAFAADAASINFNTGNPAFRSGVGLVTQSMQIQYQQPVTRLWEVGTNLTYFVAGRPQGTINIARVLGPGIVTAAFYQSFGNVCFANQNHLTFDVQAGCIPEAQVNPVAALAAGQVPAIPTNRMYFLANNIIIQSIGLSVAAQDMIINEALSLFFTSLEAFDDLLSLELACLSTYAAFC